MLFAVKQRWMVSSIFPIAEWRHANAKVPKDEQIHLHAHKLLHTGVKKVHDERGELAAKRFSRHRSFAQLELYATQTQEEHETMVDNLCS